MRDSGSHLWARRCKKRTVPHIEVISACVGIVSNDHVCLIRNFSADLDVLLNLLSFLTVRLKSIKTIFFSCG